MQLIDYDTPQQREEVKKFLKEHHCQCGGTLVQAYIGGQDVIKCGNDPEHSGYERIKGFGELLRQKGQVRWR